MKRIIALLAVCGIGAGAALAGTEKVEFPKGYQDEFVRYTTVDNEKRKIIRFMYANPASLEAAKAGAPAPHGTILVMEDHKAKLDGNENPVKDSEGRFVPTDEIINVFVQEKQEGWGAEYGPDKRNGEWEYAWFEPSGARKTGDKVNLDRCFACHKEMAEADDYTFTFSRFLKERAK